MTTQLSPMPKFFALTNTGLPLTGGLLYTYIAGTSTPKATYTDSTGDFANTNPVVLDAAGRADVWIATGKYKFILKDSIGNELWSVDNIGQESVIYNAVDTVADLRDLAENSSKLVTVLGYNEIGDGGGGMFIWDASNTDVDDGGVIIQPSVSTGAGRWRRLLNEFVTPRMYGAAGDGSTDDTDALQAADAYAQSVSPNIHILLTDGQYFIAKPAVVSKMVFSPNAILSWQANMNPSWSVSISDRFKHFDFAKTSPAYAPVLSNISEVYPEWFGALGDGSFSNNTKDTDDTTAIQAAINVCTVGMWVVLDSAKKYWCSNLTWKEGVNFRGTQSRENDTASGQSSEYQANLQFNGTSGDFITLANGGDAGQMRGIIVRDLIIDGNGVATSNIKLETNNSLIEYCTIRNCAIGIYLGGTGVRNFINSNHIYNCSTSAIAASANMTYGIIANNFIYSCVAYAISIGNGYGWIIDKNTFKGNSSVDISVTGANAKIINNDLVDISATTGINLINNAIGTSLISGNSISCLTNTGAIGITITTSVVNYVHCNNNTLYQDGALACVGIRTISSGQTLPGNIFDNNIVGFTTPYQLDGGHTTALRYQDSQGLKVYKEIVGDSSKLSTYDEDTQNVVINPTGIGADIGGESPISSEGGVSEGTTIYNRKHLIRTSTSAAWQGSRFHDAIEFDATNQTPRTDTRAWYERDPNDGSHHWGDMASELMTLSNTGLSVTLSGIPITLTNPITYGCETVGYSTEVDFNIVYNTILGLTYIYFPLVGEGSTSNSDEFIIASKHILNDNVTSNTIGDGSKTFNVGANQPIITGQALKASYSSIPGDYMIGVVTSYDSTIGTLVCNMTSHAGSGTWTLWTITLTTFPFFASGGFHADLICPCIVRNLDIYSGSSTNYYYPGIINVGGDRWILSVANENAYDNTGFGPTGINKWIPKQTIIVSFI